MIVPTMAERNLPLLQFLAAISIKLQAAITRSTDVIPEYVTHVGNGAPVLVEHFQV